MNGLMEMVPVSSSNLRAVGYDADSATLRVAFHGGGVYDYFGVPPGVHDGLMRAPSKGTFLNSRIKDRYRFRKVR